MILKHPLTLSGTRSKKTEAPGEIFTIYLIFPVLHLHDSGLTKGRYCSANYLGSKQFRCYNMRFPNLHNFHILRCNQYQCDNV